MNIERFGVLPFLLFIDNSIYYSNFSPNDITTDTSIDIYKIIGDDHVSYIKIIPIGEDDLRIKIALSSVPAEGSIIFLRPLPLSDIIGVGYAEG